MNHLSGMDASFLHLESPEMPMHVGSLQILDLPEGHAGDFYEDVKRYMGSRIHLASVFQRKLALMPFDLANPVWVDDEDVDLDYHVRHVILPRPGTFDQLEKYVARLHSSLLDRSRPLWETYVIEGLANGQVAVYNKAHHAGIDGQAGVAIAKALLSDSPNPPPVKPPRPRLRTNRYQLGVAELMGAALANSLTQTVKLVRSLPEVLEAVVGVLYPKTEGEGGKRKLSLPSFQFGPRTQLNVAITNQRSYAARTLALAEVKAMAKRSGTSLNDIVMAICAGALRRYLNDYDVRPDKPLVAGVPVSLREVGNTDANNQVSMMLVSLATDIKDPLERLAAINASANQGKKLQGSVKGVIPMDFPSLGVPWLMSGLASLYGRSRLANQIPPIANVAISNVPGPQFPLYFAGAKLAHFFPVSIPGHGLALNITVQSYNGLLEVGLTACRRALPDVGDLGDYIVDEHKKLFALIAAREAVGAAATAAAKSLPAPEAAESDAASRKKAPVAAKKARPRAAPRRGAPAKATNGAAAAPP
ncbi:MAG TPA: wax ester/triacylglycerol synthase family O-acyltransferase, partial [Burkholderiaceae bacterium]|nr:wax ester/triacylglycerol synthase family O-acyltransferase [Burkholderiaceae bacterium]